MNNVQMTARVGLFFLLGCALVWVVFESLSDGPMFRDRGYPLTAEFADLRQLKAGDEVRIAGVRVGSVAETRLAGQRAVAVLSIDPGVSIANDAVAGIAMAGLLGNNYVAIRQGTGTALSPGSAIPTEEVPDLGTVVAKLGALGDELSDALGGLSEAFGGAEGGLFQRLDRLVADNSENLTRTIDNLQDVTAKIRDGQGTIGKLINDPTAHDSLIATIEEIRGGAAEIKVFVADARGILDQVRSGQGAIGTLLYDEQTGQDLRTIATNLRTLSEKLASGEGTFGKLLSDDSLYREAQGLLRKVDRALDSFSDQGPITAVGAAASVLF